jgi:hypothetical protein
MEREREKSNKNNAGWQAIRKKSLQKWYNLTILVSSPGIMIKNRISIGRGAIF